MRSCLRHRPDGRAGQGVHRTPRTRTQGAHAARRLRLGQAAVRARCEVRSAEAGVLERSAERSHGYPPCRRADCPALRRSATAAAPRTLPPGARVDLLRSPWRRRKDIAAVRTRSPSSRRQSSPDRSRQNRAAIHSDCERRGASSCARSQRGLARALLSGARQVPADVDEPKSLERLAPVGGEDEATVETEQPETPPVPRRNHDGHAATVRQQPVARGEKGVECPRARRVGGAYVDDHRGRVIRCRLLELSARGTNTTVSMPRASPHRGRPKRLLARVHRAVRIEVRPGTRAPEPFSGRLGPHGCPHEVFPVLAALAAEEVRGSGAQLHELEVEVPLAGRSRTRGRVHSRPSRRAFGRGGARRWCRRVRAG